MRCCRTHPEMYCISMMSCFNHHLPRYKIQHVYKHYTFFVQPRSKPVLCSNVHSLMTVYFIYYNLPQRIYFYFFIFDLSGI